MPKFLSWLFSRVGVIYIIVLVFAFTCLDMKTMIMRTEIRHLNDSIPDFSPMINFARTFNPPNDVDWRPYREYFQLVVKYIPDDPMAKQLLGFAEYYAGHENRAMDLFKAGRSFKGQDLFWSDYNLGLIYYKKGDWDHAAQYFFSAVSANPQVTIWLMENSTIYRQISASSFFRKSMWYGIKDAESEAYMLLLSSLYSMKQYNKMLVVDKVALDNPQLSDKDAFYYYGGLAYLDMGRPDKALLFLEKSLELEKGNPDVYFYLAGIYQKVGQAQQAQALLGVAYALHQKGDPRFPYGSHLSLRFI